jgi:7-keto-8-aminopelargonate synthetase-like enzyme
MDERAHASLRDAATFLGCPVTTFPHRDANGLARAARNLAPNSRVILLTDGMFSSDGSVAPLKAYLRLLPRNARLLVDDSHGAGVLGKSGSGTLEHVGVGRSRIIQTITLSKAFGVSGGAILATRAICRRLSVASRLLAGSTPLPLPLAVSALKAVRVMGSSASRRRRLHENVRRIRSRLKKAGIELPDHPGPIISITPSSDRDARWLAHNLQERQIFPSLIRYAGGDSPRYFRFAISSEHTRAQLDALADALLAYFGGRRQRVRGERGSESRLPP